MVGTEIFETYMSMRIEFLVTFLFLLLILCQSRIAKVLCCGDSITQGKVAGDTIKELSYRYWLWEKLDSADYKVNMVGSNPIWFTENKMNGLKVPVSVKQMVIQIWARLQLYHGMGTMFLQNGKRLRVKNWNWI